MPFSLLGRIIYTLVHKTRSKRRKTAYKVNLPMCNVLLTFLHKSRPAPARCLRELGQVRECSVS